MARRDLQAFYDDDTLEYTLPSKEHPDGKVYRVPSPDMRTGLWLATLTDLGMRAQAGGELSEGEMSTLQLDDEQERTFYQRVLGAAYEEMLADGVSWVWFERVGRDAYLSFTMGAEVADRVLESQGKAPRPNRATRRAKGGRKSSRASTATTGSATGTVSPTSGSSTSANAPEGAAEAV